MKNVKAASASGEFQKHGESTIPSGFEPWTDADEAEVQRQIAADPDDAELTDDQAKRRMTFGQAFPDLADSIGRSRGRPAVENPKQPISLRLSQDVIEAFKATGKGWQTRMDEALRKAAGL